MRLPAATRLPLTITITGLALGAAIAFFFPAGASSAAKAVGSDTQLTIPSFTDQKESAAESQSTIRRYFPLLAAKSKTSPQAAELQLQLLGVIYQHSQPTALITIGEEATRPQRFRTGDTLPDGATLTTITNQQITMETAEGKEHILFLYPAR